jgi:Tol biopolymer transport system component
MRLIAGLVLLRALLPADDAAVDRLAGEVAGQGWIVSSARSEHGDWDLYLMRPDGTRRRNITRTPDFDEMGGRFSPDGKRLLFRRIPRNVKIRHDSWGALGQLVISRSDGSDAVVYGQTGDFPWAVWSPDGKQVACLTRTGIEIRELASQKLLRTIDRKGIFEQLFWSPDGRWFVGPANHFGESWTVVRVNAASGEVNVVAKYQNCTPDFFPDSRRIIFSSRPANQDEVDGGALSTAVGQRAGYGWTQLWMANGDGSNRALVYGEDGRHVYGGALSPDSKYVLFTRSTTDGGMDSATIHVMRLSDAPIIGGESKALRKLYPGARNGPVLTLPAGWEPHWTSARIEDSR